MLTTLGGVAQYPTESKDITTRLNSKFHGGIQKQCTFQICEPTRVEKCICAVGLSSASAETDFMVSWRVYVRLLWNYPIRLKIGISSVFRIMFLPRHDDCWSIVLNTLRDVRCLSLQLEERWTGRIPVTRGAACRLQSFCVSFFWRAGRWISRQNRARDETVFAIVNKKKCRVL